MHPSVPQSLVPVAAPASPRANAADSQPTVSVIVPTFNRRARLQRVLAALGEQTYPRSCFEVVVVSDGSHDGTDDYLRNDPPFELTFVAQPNAGPAAARNHGLQVAAGQVVAFVDDDVIAAPDLLERHAQHHQAGDGVVVIGPMLTPADADLSPWVLWEQAMLYRQYEAMLAGEYAPTARQFYTGNASVARDTVIAAGGFDTRFRRAEDIELGYRLEAAGLRFVFDPDAVGYHHADRSFDAWWKNAYDYGVVDAILARDQRRRSVSATVSHGFLCRSAAVQFMTRTCLRRRRVEAVARGAFRLSYATGGAVHVDRLIQASLSGLYNLAYYRGVADELGGVDAFTRAVTLTDGAWA